MSLAIGTVSRVWPSSGALIAEKIWLRSRGRAVSGEPNGAESFAFSVGRRDLHGYTLGTGPNVLLLHGWGGARTDMNHLAIAVAGAGRRAIVPDLPGHGHDRGRPTDLFRMAAAIDAVVAMYGPANAVVAHSFGATAALSAFLHGGPRRIVYVAPALDAAPFFDWFAQKLQLSPRAVERFRRRVARYAGPHNMAAFRGEVVVPGADVLIVHDPGDTRTSYAGSQRYAAQHPNVRLMPVDSVGHAGILSDERTTNAMLGHLR